MVYILGLKLSILSRVVLLRSRRLYTQTTAAAALVAMAARQMMIAVRLQKAMEEERIEAEKERIRAERRAANPEGITTNTSKKKLQKQQRDQEQAAKAAAAKEYAARKGILEGEDAFHISTYRIKNKKQSIYILIFFNFCQLW